MFHIYVAMIFKHFSSVLEACFKCFIYLQTSVASECFKNRMGVANVMRLEQG
jgi:hypothetical protein